ncbi:MAG: hypothetical protein Tsb0016_05870 [Sphingomonadales bacterium]
MLLTPLPARLTPLAQAMGYRSLYGDIHNHCNLSYAHGKLEDALARAKRQLDFVSVTGHAYWPDMPVEDESVAHIVDFHIQGFERLQKLWPGHFATLKDYEQPGRFAVYPGYEIHSSEHGDYTIVYPDLEPSPLILADTPEDLKARLAARPGGALAFPHHIGYRQGARGINWATFDAELSPFVEMYSMHGCADESDTDRPYLHSMGPLNGHSTMAHGLALGHVFGVVGNSDHHSAYPGSYGHGRMAVLAASHDRDAIWQAMMARRTVALTGDRIHLCAGIDGTPIGGVLGPRGDAVLNLEAVGGGAIDMIDILRNGRLFRRITPALEPSPIDPMVDPIETILVLEMGWGARGSSHRWAGDLDIAGGKILSAEPRLRGPDIVSPTEGRDDSRDTTAIECEDSRVHFDITAMANRNNFTPATQAIALRVQLSEDSHIALRLGNYRREVPVERLLEGALSDNLGAIDTPAYRLHGLPLPHQWQWHGKIPLGSLRDGESVHVKLRQKNGQTAWTSPIFCRA